MEQKEYVVSVGVELFAKHLFLALLLLGGMLKRDGKAYMQIVSNCQNKDLIAYIRVFGDLENSTIFSDSLIMGLPLTAQKNILE